MYEGEISESLKLEKSENSHRLGGILWKGNHLSGQRNGRKCNLVLFHCFEGLCFLEG